MVKIKQRVKRFATGLKKGDLASWIIFVIVSYIIIASFQQYNIMTDGGRNNPALLVAAPAVAAGGAAAGGTALVVIGIIISVLATIFTAAVVKVEFWGIPAYIWMIAGLIFVQILKKKNKVQYYG